MEGSRRPKDCFRRLSEISHPRRALFLALLLACVVACQPKPMTEQPSGRDFLGIRKIVVFGFSPALSPGDPSGIFRDSLTGGVFPAEPVSDAVAYSMTRILFERLLAKEKYELLTPGQAKGAFSEVVRLDPNAELGAQQVLSRMGTALGGDVVLAGKIYRYRDRVGTDYAVDQPASVAFGLYMIRSVDGAVLWRRSFDKTQKSLTENVFEWDMFYRSRGRWLTAEQMIVMGLDQVIGQLPLESGKPGHVPEKKNEGGDS